jgi:beta-lactam-binding protein with PASTA domain
MKKEAARNVCETRRDVRTLLRGAVYGALAAVIVGLALLYVLDLEVTENDRITVPDVIGEKPAQAQSDLEAVGLSARVIPVQSEPAFRSVILKHQALVVGEQFPARGTEVAPGTTIALHVK